MVPGRRGARGSQDPHPTAGRRCHSPAPGAHVLSDASLSGHGRPTNMSKIAVKLSRGPAHLSVLILLPVLTASKHIAFPVSSRMPHECHQWMPQMNHKTSTSASQACSILPGCLLVPRRCQSFVVLQAEEIRPRLPAQLPRP